MRAAPPIPGARRFRVRSAPPILARAMERIARTLAAAAPFTLAAALTSCTADGDRYVSVYGGRYSDSSLPEEIALLRNIEIEDATMVAAAYSEVIAEPSEHYRWELEGNVAHWIDGQDHTELNGLVMFRWLSLPWDRWLDSSFGFGNGLSWATEEPSLEAEFHPETGTQQLLWYIAAELTFAVPGTEDWETFLRVHHRSGVFGTFGGVDGGSNVIALGLRWRL